MFPARLLTIWPATWLSSGVADQFASGEKGDDCEASQHWSKLGLNSVQCFGETLHDQRLLVTFRVPIDAAAS